METDIWEIFFSLDVLLVVAVVLGALFERLRQSAIIGYLVAGMLIGPGGLHLIDARESVEMLAELGVALLLFTIGLEFSFNRLRSMGRFAILGGTLQVVITVGVFSLGAMLLGVPVRLALVIGILIAPSSTACVLRLLRDRSEMDSIHGRNATGILLLQDLALVPLVLAVTLLGQGGGTWLEATKEVALAGGAFALFVALFYVLSRSLLPRFLSIGASVRSRELLILAAVALALGSIWLAHYLRLSPALGAFVAGMMIAGTKFAPQVRADVAPLRVLFVTLFFISIGMLGDLTWMSKHWLDVLGLCAVILIVKSGIIAVLTHVLQGSRRNSVATAVCLAQVGEFSFVLAQTARNFGIFDDDKQSLFASAAILSMICTPTLVRYAPRLGDAVRQGLARFWPSVAPHAPDIDEAGSLRDHFIVVGYGPAARRVVKRLREVEAMIVVVEMNPQGFRDARAAGALPVLGDASMPDVLEHAHVGSARAVIVTVPDHRAALATVNEVAQIAPHVPIITRSRHSQYARDLLSAGSRIAIDEEAVMGIEICSLVERLFLKGANRA